MIETYIVLLNAFSLISLATLTNRYMAQPNIATVVNHLQGVQDDVGNHLRRGGIDSKYTRSRRCRCSSATVQRFSATGQREPPAASSHFDTRAK